MNETLTFWVVYENPSDYPQQFVLRRQHAMRDGTVRADPHPAVVAGTLEEARKLIPPGLRNIGRMPGDDPVIREVWL